MLSSVLPPDRLSAAGRRTAGFGFNFPESAHFFIRSSSSGVAFGFSCVFMSPSISLRLVPVYMFWTEHEYLLKLKKPPPMAVVMYWSAMP
jgi:hypothetical protein